MEQTKRKNLRAYLAFILSTAVLLVVVIVSMSELNRYTQKQLYQECKSQLTEITEQVYEKLGTMLDSQWGYLVSLSNLLQRRSELTTADLARLMGQAEIQLSTRDDNIQFIALDGSGNFYTNQGRQGVWEAIGEMDFAKERQSFLITDWQSSDNLMAFVLKLDTNVPLDAPAGLPGAHQLTHVVLLKKMSQLTSYFRSSAFENQNVTYVLKSSGVKMYTDNTVENEAFQGRNIYHALRKLEYPHEGSFDACLEQLHADGYTCTDTFIAGERYYLCLKQLPGYDWILLFLVPSTEVAASTRLMVNSILRIFVGIVFILLALSFVVFFYVMRFRKNEELLAIKTESEAQLTAANEKLEATNQSLRDARAAAVEALRMAENASKAKTDFLSNMSHDIRTPMNAIFGISQLMEHEIDQPDKLRGHIAKLQSSSQHLLSLINDVLDMSRIESGKAALHIEPINLPEQLEQITDIVRASANEHDQTLTVDTQNLLHENVLGDSTRLRQVLINVLSNAVKYTPDGGAILFEAHELPRDGHTYARYQFRITDNGIGMTPEFQQHIFDPFARAESSVTNKVQGTGLGMAITKNLVEMMGGTIRVESALGKGSCFEIMLEFKIDTSAAAAKPEASAPDGASTLNGMRFLCAEDNAINAEILEALLEMAGASCTIYPNGKELVDAFANVQPGQYDMILMDVQMPVMNGYEATRAIRASANPLGQTIPILAMTANAFSEDVQHSLDAGMDAHLSKPVDLKALEETVRKYRVPPPEK